jgi:5-methylcytosine-specific restriction endonuclease McrA
MTNKLQLNSISDDELLRRLSELLRQSRRVESELVAHIAEVDERRLYAREACPSMFAYCIEALNMSEAEAYLRIGVARASRKHPMLLAMLGDGRLHLTGIAKLAPYLTEANRDAVLSRAVGKSKRKIEELVAEIAPKPDVAPAIRKLPTSPKTPAEPAAQLRPDAVGPRPTPGPVRVTKPARIEPLAPARYKVQFTASAELKDKHERLQALMPDGDLAAIIEEAVTEKLERLESRRFGRTKAPRKNLEETDTSPSSRYIPAPVKRAVSERDRNQCTYVDAHGRHCTERDGLQFHHRQPYGRGGDHSAENIQLICRTHNAYLAEQDYGQEVMEKYRRSGSYAREPAPIYSIPPF